MTPKNIKTNFLLNLYFKLIKTLVLKTQIYHDKKVWHCHFRMLENHNYSCENE